MTDHLGAALDYSRRGWGVLPLRAGEKVPDGRLAPHGLHDASTDPEVIRAWWEAEPEANVGLVTGIHFDVLDVDGPDALERLQTAGSPGDPDIEGPVVATPRGWHVYVSCTGRGNTVNLGGLAGVDWRGRGGYVVAPPSVKADGTSWSWVTGTPLDVGPDTPIVAAPDWVLALFDRKPGFGPTPEGARGTPARHGGRTAYGAAALERELGRLVLAPIGARNHTLNASAFSLGQLVAAEALEGGEVALSLLEVARRIGLPDAESEPTITSGLTAGIRSPRQVAS